MKKNRFDQNNLSFLTKLNNLRINFKRKYTIFVESNLLDVSFVIQSNKKYKFTKMKISHKYGEPELENNIIVSKNLRKRCGFSSSEKISLTNIKIKSTISNQLN